MAIDYNTADSVIQTLSGFGKGGSQMFKRSGVWWTCIRHNGRKIQKSLETDLIGSLQKLLRLKIRTEIVEGSYFEKLVGRE